MSFWTDVFRSPREQQGREKGQQAMQEAENAYGDLSSIQNVYDKFGVKKFDVAGYESKVREAFDPKRRSLATRLGQALSRNTSMRSATPGMTNAGIETGFAEADSNLDSAQAQQELAGYDKEMQSNQANAGLYAGLISNKLNAKNNSLNTYLQSLSDSSIAGDVLRGATAIAGIPTGKNMNILTSGYELLKKK